jgi:spore germination cell wall hydrolase CwlJ-like protein
VNIHNASILELGLAPRFLKTAGFRFRKGRDRNILLSTIAGIVLLAIGLGFAGPLVDWLGIAAPARAEPNIQVTMAEKHHLATLTVDDPQQIVVEGNLARLRNAQIPQLTGPLQLLSGFQLSSEKTDAYRTALSCLSQAVYYEAAWEPLPGKRAVAQVVLNRMRHPAYPKSVCGVVYQGSERRTGCQFSFTCDGSLLRRPAAGAWDDAVAVARAALGGFVEPSVGTATHYHADYVLPKWAFELAKLQKIGAHIFYRFRGTWGSSAAFDGRYSGIERIPQVDLAALRAELDQADDVGTDAAGAEPTLASHITDRHAPSDIGGRIDVSKEWRLTIPDPVSASIGYKSVLDMQELAPGQSQAEVTEQVAIK